MVGVGACCWLQPPCSLVRKVPKANAEVDEAWWTFFSVFRVTSGFYLTCPESIKLQTKVHVNWNCPPYSASCTVNWNCQCYSVDRRAVSFWFRWLVGPIWLVRGEKMVMSVVVRSPWDMNGISLWIPYIRVHSTTFTPLQYLASTDLWVSVPSWAVSAALYRVFQNLLLLLLLLL